MKNPAKTPWQEKLAAWLVLCRRGILSIDIERIAFHPAEFSLKSAVYRIFIFGLAMADAYGLSYGETRKEVYNTTYRYATARPKMKITI